MLDEFVNPKVRLEIACPAFGCLSGFGFVVLPLFEAWSHHVEDCHCKDPSHPGGVFVDGRFWLVDTFFQDPRYRQNGVHSGLI